VTWSMGSVVYFVSNYYFYDMATLSAAKGDLACFA